MSLCVCPAAMCRCTVRSCAASACVLLHNHTDTHTLCVLAPHCAVTYYTHACALTILCQVFGEVQSCLATHGRQDGIRALLHKVVWGWGAYRVRDRDRDRGFNNTTGVGLRNCWQIQPVGVCLLLPAMPAATAVLVSSSSAAAAAAVTQVTPPRRPHTLSRICSTSSGVMGPT